MRNLSIFRLSLTLALAAFVAACAPAKQQKVESATAKEPYELKSEGEIPPLEESDVREEADIEEKVLTEEPIEVEEAEAPVDTSTPPPPPAMMPGFRVQIFAAVAEDLARRAGDAATERLGVHAYVELIDEMYKVRVGDCVTREEAQVLLGRCQETYYLDAWIVETPVRLDRAGSESPDESP